MFGHQPLLLLCCCHSRAEELSAALSPPPDTAQAVNPALGPGWVHPCPPSGVRWQLEDSQGSWGTRALRSHRRALLWERAAAGRGRRAALGSPQLLLQIPGESLLQLLGQLSPSDRAEDTPLQQQRETRKIRNVGLF